MNRTFAILVSLAAGLSAFAQLGTVNLNNDFTPAGSSTKAFIVGYDGLPLAKALGSIEVLDGNGNVIKSGGLDADGLFFLGDAQIPGTSPGGSGVVIIRAWDNSTGSGYATASVRNQAIVTLTGLGGGAIPTPGLGTAGNFTGMQVPEILDMPEPSSVALAALGMVGLFMVGRRR
ncbi:MAG: PEP-CTERM sorting domain-containing protein [Verrucomicrobiota bacterium]